MARNCTQCRCPDRHGRDFAIVPVIIIVIRQWRRVIPCRRAVARRVSPLVGLRRLLPALLRLLLLRLSALLRLLSVLLPALLLLLARLLGLLS